MNETEIPQSDGRTARGVVGLLVTCLVDLLRPSVGFASARLLQNAGFDVRVPVQGCCGQPNVSNGDVAGAAAMARGVISAFDGCDFVVVPSGSCASIVRLRYPELFESGSAEHAAACDLASRTHELASFLHDVAGVEALPGSISGRIAYHDACSGLRDLGIREQPRRLLGQLPGVELAELSQPEVCCGFGGAFCVRHDEISERMTAKKVADIEASGASCVVGGDLGCLLSIAGKLHRDGSRCTVLHIAEALDGTAVPSRGES